MGESHYNKKQEIIINFFVLLLMYILSFDRALAEEISAEPSDIEIIETVIEQLEQEDGDFFTEASMSWIETKRRALSGDIVSLGEYIDELMGDVDVIADHNQSYVRLYLGLAESRFDDVEILPRIRFSLDLPITKKRFRFILESENEETGEALPSDQETGISTLDDTLADDGISASFRFLFEADNWDRLSFDWGAKARLKPDLFSRARGIRRWSLTDKWSMSFSPELFWFESRGAGVQTKFDFDRVVLNSCLFRFRALAIWHERYSTISYLPRVSFFHDISRRRAIEYAVGLVADEQDNHTLVTEYFTQVAYRRNLYKGWLFYQMNIGTAFPREFDYRVNPFVGVRLEILLSDDLEKVLKTSLY